MLGAPVHRGRQGALHRDTLPPASQFEGIASASAERIGVRVMTGVEPTTIACHRAPDGTLTKSGG